RRRGAAGRPADPHPGPRRRLLLPDRQPHHEGNPAMSTLPYAITDSATMLRRSLRHMQRYPSLTVLVAGMPVVFLLLFVYVFGGTLGAGIGGAAGGRTFYVNYVVPGGLLVAVAAAAQGTAVAGALGQTHGRHR